MRTKKDIFVLIVTIWLAAGCTSVSGPADVSTAFPPPQKTWTASPNIIVVTPTVPFPSLPAHSGQEFCDNEWVQQTLENLEAALLTKDGQALAKLIDPEGGLDLFYTSANPPVKLTLEAATGIFESEVVFNWGTQPGSGLPVEGTFIAEILPSLLDVFERDHTQACQTLETGSGTGPTTAVVDWPEQFSDMPFIARYRASGPQDNELDWRTWAVGFTVVKGEPKIRVLVQYFWEI